MAADIVVVTGASRGLGRNIAERLLAQGVEIIGVARRPTGDEPFETISCDVGDADAVKTAFRRFNSEKRLWGFVNAAGIASMNLVVATPPETMERILRTNLLGTMLTNQAMGKAMARNKRGRIVNFSTIAVPLGLKGEAIYVASKAGVEGFTRAFAREMADFGVTVNAVAPGPVDTNLIAKIESAKIDAIVARQIITRRATPDDVWDIVALLLEQRAGMISGEIIHVGGA